MKLTSDQIRGARAMLGWTIEKMADHADLTPSTILDLEHGKGNPLERTLRKVELAVNRAGFEFADGGVRPLQNRVVTLQGREGFAAFRADVLHDAQAGPLNVCVSNVDENQFDKWGEGKVNDDYRASMAKIKNLHFKILIKEDEQHMTGSRYATYRWLPVKLFGEISFYIYGDKVAIISFLNDNFNAFIISHKEIAEFYRKDFNRLWDQAREVNV